MNGIKDIKFETAIYKNKVAINGKTTSTLLVVISFIWFSIHWIKASNDNCKLPAFSVFVTSNTNLFLKRKAIKTLGKSIGSKYKSYKN